MEENELLQNELLAGDLPEESEEPTYNIIYSPGTSTGLFDPRTGTEDRTGDAEYNGEMRVEQLTESQIKERWDADTFLQDQFGDFDNYMGYVSESSDAFAETNWWESKGVDNRTEAEKLREDEDLGRGDAQTDSEYDQKQSDDNARKSGYQKWLTSDENQALMEKYGVSDTVMNDKGDKYIWMGNGYTLVDEADEAGFHDYAKMGLTVAMSVALGNAAGALSGLTGAAGGAVSGATGSLIQGAINGDLSAEGIIKGAITGAIGGWADQLKGMDGAIMDSSILGGMDDAVNATADLLGLPYDEALGLLQGVAQGAVNGEDLDGIILGAVSGWGTSKTQDFLQGMYGDEVNVQDWFKDGQSNIPIEALNPFIEGAWNAALSGEGDMGDLAKMLWEYHREGGDLDFILPPGVDIPDGGALDWINAQLPDVTINWGSDEFDVTYEEGLGEDEGFEEEEKDKITVDIPGVDIPDVDIDIDVPEVKCPTGEKWSTNLSKCIPDIDIDIPEVKCPTGQKWSSDLSQCVPELDINVPEVKCPTGEKWSSDLSQCVPELDINVPEVKCPAGEKWSSDLSKCVPELEVPEVKCPTGEKWSSDLSKCVPELDVEIPEVKCPAGEKWSSDLSECVPELDVEIPEVDVEVPEIKCPTGEKWSSDLSECVPDLPDVPSLGGGSGSGYKATPQGLFSYTTLTPYEKKAIEPIVDYVAKAKGMLS